MLKALSTAFSFVYHIGACQWLMHVEIYKILYDPLFDLCLSTLVHSSCLNAPGDLYFVINGSIDNEMHWCGQINGHHSQC